MHSTDDYRDCGIVYVATGKRYVDEALISARSAKAAMPHIAITLFADEKVAAEPFDSVVVLSAPTRSYGDKLVGILRSPYSRTLFLDSDTYVCQDMSDCFDMLHRFDLMAAHDALRINTAGPPLPAAFPEFNSGMIWYQRDRCQPFLDAWKRAHERACAERGPHVPDQLTFRETLYSTPTSFYVLPPEYHCMVWEASYVCGAVKMLHGRHDIPLAQLAADVNAQSDARIFKAGLGACTVRYKSDVLRWAARVAASQAAEAMRLH